MSEQTEEVHEPTTQVEETVSDSGGLSDEGETLEKPAKPKRGRRPMSEKQKEALAKGREKARLAQQKRMYREKLDKIEKDEAKETSSSVPIPAVPEVNGEDEVVVKPKKNHTKKKVVVVADPESDSSEDEVVYVKKKKKAKPQKRRVVESDSSESDSESDNDRRQVPPPRYAHPQYYPRMVFR